MRSRNKQTYISRRLALHIEKSMVQFKLCSLHPHKLQFMQNVLQNNITQLFCSLQAWSYGWAGFFRKFSLISFLSLYENYLVEHTGLTRQHAARCNTVLGCFLIAGMLTSSATHRIKCNRLASHSFTQILCGVFIMCLTALQTEVIYFLIPNFFVSFS